MGAGLKRSAQAAASATEKGISPAGQGQGKAATEPFWGEHQGGILTPSQNHTCFAAFDVTATEAKQVTAMLQRWTDAAARMTEGQTAAPLGSDLSVPAADSGEALGLAPARLTLTFGFGATLFVKDGKDRFGLAAHRPDALVDMPGFNGDQLVEARTGGDFSVQACADDPQVAFHAVRQLTRLAYGAAEIRWLQNGFSANFAAEDTPRNLMGFKDGTQNPIARPPVERSGGAVAANPRSPEDILWIGEEGPDWMAGGSYLVVRRIRVSLEHWDRTDTEFQEQVIGRHKQSGSPLGGSDEFAALDLDATDKDGNSVIPDDAHVRLASAASNGGAQLLRRGYSYNDGVSFTAERWPPWRQGMMFDAGLFFVAYQRDPRTGFIKIYDQMSKLDALNQFSTHVGSGLFACPGGVRQGEFIGQRLFRTA
ncbi:MAG: deferrochelatase/peroxidase EfeB, partial [Acetobacteraceae bacterium]|nr:deferrochelatase/peroxidase EfeB [Acetobacteraceae bacterium]